MQPYQEASQEIRRQGELPGKALKTVGSLAATAGSAYAGGSILGRVVPFLNKYIPEDLAIKGLSKIDPRFGTFIKKALSAGKSFDEVKEFITGKAEEGERSEKAKESRNIIEQESPELHQFIDQEVKNGREVIQAGALAQNDKRFKSIIDKLTKQHKTPWSSILRSIYGMGTTAQPESQSKAALQSQQPHPNSARGRQLAREAMQPSGSIPENPPSAEAQAAMQQPGQGQQALMGILQKINQRLGQ